MKSSLLASCSLLALALARGPGMARHQLSVRQNMPRFLNTTTSPITSTGSTSSPDSVTTTSADIPSIPVTPTTTTSAHTTQAPVQAGEARAAAQSAYNLMGAYVNNPTKENAERAKEQTDNAMALIWGIPGGGGLGGLFNSLGQAAGNLANAISTPGAQAVAAVASSMSQIKKDIDDSDDDDDHTSKEHSDKTSAKTSDKTTQTTTAHTTTQTTETTTSTETSTATMPIPTVFQDIVTEAPGGSDEIVSALIAAQVPGLACLSTFKLPITACNLQMGSETSTGETSTETTFQGTTTSPDTTTRHTTTHSPDATTSPETTTSQDITTSPETTTSQDITTSPDTTSQDITTSPETTTSQDITTSPDTTSSTSSEPTQPADPQYEPGTCTAHITEFGDVTGFMAEITISDNAGNFLADNSDALGDFDGTFETFNPMEWDNYYWIYSPKLGRNITFDFVSYVPKSMQRRRSVQERDHDRFWAFTGWDVIVQVEGMRWDLDSTGDSLPNVGVGEWNYDGSEDSMPADTIPVRDMDFRWEC